MTLLIYFIQTPCNLLLELVHGAFSGGWLRPKLFFLAAFYSFTITCRIAGIVWLDPLVPRNDIC